MGVTAYRCSTALEVFGLNSLSAAEMLSLNYIFCGYEIVLSIIELAEAEVRVNTR